MNTSLKLSKRLSFGEEIANSVTHAVGAVLMLVLLPISSTYSYEEHGLLSSVGVSIFVISLFLMFLSSTIYHSMAYGSTHKYVLRIIDHSMIYVAIAGSYTPVVLTLMNNWFGYLIIAIQWGTTIFGILYKIFAKKVNEKFSLILYLVMGWLVLAILPAIISQTTPIISSVGEDVDVLAIVNDQIVAAQEKNMLVTSFHPELTNDLRLHQYFMNMCK